MTDAARRMIEGRRSHRRLGRLPLALVVLGWSVGPTARGQSPPATTTTTAPAATASGREAQLEDRVRQLESLLRKMPDPERVRRLEEKLGTLPDPAEVQRLRATIQTLSTEVDKLSGRLAESEARRVAAPAGVGAGAAGGAGRDRGDAVGGAAGLSPTEPAPSPAVPGGAAGEGAGAAGGSGRDRGDAAGGPAGLSPSASEPSPRFDMPEPIPDFPLKARFGPGFNFKSADDEFDLQFHDLTQIDGRFYGNGNQRPISDTFSIPRQWFIFNGHMTKPLEYYLSIVDAFDSFNLLDVFLNVNYNKAFQFRFGRFKTPFTYEFYAEPTQGLANGEWSLFFNNFGYNRDLGAMVWGQAADDRLDYAAGIFNSTRNGYVDLSNPKEFIGFLNFAPFKAEKGSPLENFNIGGSAVAGGQNHAPIPQELRTIVPTTGNGAIGVPFLQFNNNVLASGPQAFWSLHAAYYYQQLSLIGEWQGGFEDYALAGGSTRTRVPVESFYVQAAYFLTGERVASRGMVRPFHAFDLRPGRRGAGAWELAARFSTLNLGNQVFTGGLADPNLWTDSLYATDLGVNWYWNQYVRLLFDWQHAGFGSPVVDRPGGFQRASDLFFLRFQLWF